MNTGNNLLYLVVAALLGFMAVTGLAGKNNLDGMTVDVAAPEEVYAGVPTLLRLKLRNRRRTWPLFLLRVELCGGTTVVPVLGGGAERLDLLAVTFSRRGRQRLETIRVASRFPVNFFVRSRQLTLEREVMVFPQPLATALTMEEPRGERVGTLVSRRRGSDGELARIGDYSGREPLKQVHWKLSARQGSLKVKEYAAAGCRPLVIDVDTLAGGIEERLRSASFLVNRATREGRPVGLRLAGQCWAAEAGKAHKLRLLRALALYGCD